MKIRNGFVSNSSSSSFLITSENVIQLKLNTVKVALEFFKDHIKYLKEDYYDLKKDQQNKMVNSLKWLEKNKNTTQNPSICFNSCNYDTYIWMKKDGSIQINTCNNEDWNRATNKVQADFYGDGADDNQWEDCSMDYSSDTLCWQEPNKKAFVDLDGDLQKWPDLTTIRKITDRFIAILKE